LLLLHLHALLLPQQHPAHHLLRLQQRCTGLPGHLCQQRDLAGLLPLLPLLLLQRLPCGQLCLLGLLLLLLLLLLLGQPWPQ
jgi:hypothetical protein